MLGKCARNFAFTERVTEHTRVGFGERTSRLDSRLSAIFGLRLRMPCPVPITWPRPPRFDLRIDNPPTLKGSSPSSCSFLVPQPTAPSGSSLPATLSIVCCFRSSDDGSSDRPSSHLCTSLVSPEQSSHLPWPAGILKPEHTPSSQSRPRLS